MREENAIFDSRVTTKFFPGLIFKSLDVDSYDFEGIVKLSHCSGAWYRNPDLHVNNLMKWIENVYTKIR